MYCRCRPTCHRSFGFRFTLRLGRKDTHDIRSTRKGLFSLFSQAETRIPKQVKFQCLYKLWLSFSSMFGFNRKEQRAKFSNIGWDRAVLGEISKKQSFPCLSPLSPQLCISIWNFQQTVYLFILVFMFLVIMTLLSLQVRLTHEVQERWTAGDIKEVGSCTPPSQPHRQEGLTVLEPGKIKRGKAGTKVRLSFLNIIFQLAVWYRTPWWDIKMSPWLSHFLLLEKGVGEGKWDEGGRIYEAVTLNK